MARKVQAMSKAAPAKPASKEAGAGEQKKGGKKKLVLIAAPVLLAAVLGGLWFTGILPGMLGMGHDKKVAAEHKAGGGDAAAATQAAAKAAIYVDVPEIVANLDAGPRRTSYVKVKPKLELAKASDEKIVTENMPRLLDMFTTYLRDMRPDELRGSAGTYRLREELIARANIALAPGRVVDVLFTEMIVQ
jgi:flagellar FliL protein